MSAIRFYLCLHCKKEHANPASAAICHYEKNARWACSDCDKVYEDPERAEKCCSRPKPITAVV